ncbi:MAG: penicillin-binding protein 1C [Verrucomicrobia bacterium]|nr:MAG: penicillin-binding protein 1C [Verrucomicrobiota bacterium]
MKTRVIPIPQSRERDLSKALVSRYLSPVIRAPSVRSFALLGMTAWFAWLLLPKPPLLDGISFSQCVRDRNGKLLRVTLSADQKFRIWTPLEDISADLIDATLRYEDKYYAHHPGVNPLALARCALDLLRFHRVTAGGSTITMQLARLRFHLHTRNISGKLEQIIRSVELERHYSKNEILEAYLNLAPYGRNIEGAGAASQIYFDKPASKLSRPEAVALSVIPQSPTRRALHIDRDNHSINLAQSNWYDRAKIDSNAEFSMRNFQPRMQTEQKFFAPHFVQQVLESSHGRDQIITTLDFEKQRAIERRVTGYIASNRNRSIENAAVLLVDTRTMDVLAQVGSADFNNAAINGQVDGTRSPRSPGSTLKPFVYALALEQGLIHPLSILADAPRSFGEYNPENFDREFLGPIRACDALARSRNVPAVELASHVAHPTLYQFLNTADVHLPKPESFYGLALPLGGAEVSLQDLVRLYAALANNGQLRLLRRIENDPVAKSRRILSPEAAFLTLEMLGNVPRPEMNCADGTHSAPVYWKTGTSHGFRDAWSIAVFDHYVLGVWVGNFDGRANPAFVGRTAAAPLLFQIIDSLRAAWPEPSVPHLPPPGSNLKRVEFCALSGDLPNQFCTQHVEGWFIPGVSPIKTCDVHREVLVDVASGLRVPLDDGTRQLRREVYEFWPGEFLTLFEQAGIPRRVPPPFLPNNGSELASRSGQKPVIVSPSKKEIVLASTKRIPLRAKAEGDVREIFWFAGKQFVGKAAPNQVVEWTATAGDYEITALDDHGRADSHSVTVR